MGPSKRYREADKLIEKDRVYSIEEALNLLKDIPHPKFDETVELNCKLGVDPRQSDQMVRGSVTLPHGRGKKIKILVFCEPEKEETAKKAGADYIGSQELTDKISKEGWLGFDYCISTPSMMRSVSRLGKVLGPRGLMPSPKTGTVTENIACAVEEAKKGKIDFRMDKFGCIHAGLGKISFKKEALAENIKAFLNALLGARPSTLKGELIKVCYLSLTMSPALKIKL